MLHTSTRAYAFESRSMLHRGAFVRLPHLHVLTEIQPQVPALQDGASSRNPLTKFLSPLRQLTCVRPFAATATNHHVLPSLCSVMQTPNHLNRAATTVSHGLTGLRDRRRRRTTPSKVTLAPHAPSPRAPPALDLNDPGTARHRASSPAAQSAQTSSHPSVARRHQTATPRARTATPHQTAMRAGGKTRSMVLRRLLLPERLRLHQRQHRRRRRVSCGTKRLRRSTGW